MDTFAALLEVQDADTAVSQLEYQLGHHELLGAISDAETELARADDGLAEAQAARVPAAAEQDRLEGEIARSQEKVTKLDASLYDGSVTAHKDLEAIQHQIAHLRERIGELEDEELVCMEQLEPLDSQLVAAAQRQATATDALERARALWAPARSGIEAQLAELSSRRAGLASAVPTDLLAEYAGIAARSGGIGAARLDAGRCTGCHLKIPAADLAALRTAPPEAVLHCPECNRILVR